MIWRRKRWLWLKNGRLPLKQGDERGWKRAKKLRFFVVDNQKSRRQKTGGSSRGDTHGKDCGRKNCSNKRGFTKRNEEIISNKKVHLCGISVVTAYLVDIFADSSISPLSLLIVSSFSGIWRDRVHVLTSILSEMGFSFLQLAVADSLGRWAMSYPSERNQNSHLLIWIHQENFLDHLRPRHWSNHPHLRRCLCHGFSIWWHCKETTHILGKKHQNWIICELPQY